MPNWLKTTLKISGLAAGTIGAVAAVISTGPVSLPLVIKAIAAGLSALTAGAAGWTMTPPGAPTPPTVNGSQPDAQ